MQAAVSRHPLPVTAAATDSAQEVAHGTLSFLDNNVDSLTGTVTGKASFTNSDRRLWPGELVFLTVQLRVESGVLAVPTEAILTGQQGPYVFVVDASNTARMRQVLPGLQVNDLTVVQNGLTSANASWSTDSRVSIKGRASRSPELERTRAPRHSVARSIRAPRRANPSAVKSTPRPPAPASTGRPPR